MGNPGGPIVSPTASFRTVVMLSQLVPLPWPRPLRSPTGTSLVAPRIALVIGVTVTEVSRWGLDWRVRIKAGARPDSPWRWSASVQPGMGQVERAVQVGIDRLAPMGKFDQQASSPRWCWSRCMRRCPGVRRQSGWPPVPR